MLNSKFFLIINLILLLFLLDILSSSLRLNHKIVFFDIGQGSMTLIKAKSGNNYLIDTGKEGSSLSKLRAELRYNQKIKILFLSHFDADHIGESVKILNHFEVENIVLPYFDKNAESFIHRQLNSRLVDYIKNGGNVLIAKKDFQFQINNLIFKILGPEKIVKNENDNSLIIKFSVFDFDYLFLGDISQKIEKQISPSELQDIEVFSLAHHGSKNSNSEFLLSHLENSISVSQAKKSVYGHPSQEVLDRLKKYKIINFNLEERERKLIFSISKDLFEYK